MKRALPFILALTLVGCAHTQVRDDAPGSGGGIGLDVAHEAARAYALGSLAPGGLQTSNGGPNEHAGQAMSSRSLTTTESSGAAYGLVLDGSRIGFNGANSTTFAVGSASAISFYISSGEAVAVTSQGLTTVGAGRYLQTSATGTGAPTAADCDNNAERGKLYVETTNNRLYVCNGGTRLWDYVALTD